MKDPSRSLVFLLFLLVVLATMACSDSLGPADDDAPGDTSQGADSSLTYESALLGTLGGEVGWARGINAHNEVVGAAENGAGELRAFVWRDGSMRELQGLGGSFSGAYAINDGGVIVGEAETADGKVRAVLWRNGEPEDLGTLGGSFSQALAVNDLDQVVGRSERADGFTRPFLWSDGEMKELPLPPVESEDFIFASADGINDQGQVVGTWAGSLDHALQAALIWNDGEPAGLASPCFEAAAFDINVHGDAVGGGLGCPRAPVEVVPLIWRAASESDYLEPLGGLQEPDEHGMQNVGNASAVNARGQVAGWSDAADDVLKRDVRATLWHEGEPLDLVGESANSAAHGINGRSVAVGQLHGEPALFVPGSEKDLLPALRAAIGRAARGVEPGAEPPGARALERLAGSRAHEAWAVRLCAGMPRVASGPTAAEVLAGCR